MAFTRLLDRLEVPAVPHGFRSSFKGWTLAETSYPWAVSEAVLAHNLGNSLESACLRCCSCGGAYQLLYGPEVVAGSPL